MGSIRTIDFHGDPLLGFEAEGVVLIPLRPLVTGMGLDWSGQLQRLRRNRILAEAVVMTPTTASPAGDKDGVCLPLDLVPGFLFTVDASRVAEPIRAKVLDYQRHCFKVLATAFLSPERAFAAIAAPVQGVPFDVARKLVGEARRTYGFVIAQELWKTLGLPRVAGMDLGPAQGALFTYRREA